MAENGPCRSNPIPFCPEKPFSQTKSGASFKSDDNIGRPGTVRFSNRIQAEVDHTTVVGQVSLGGILWLKDVSVFPVESEALTGAEPSKPQSQVRKACQCNVSSLEVTGSLTKHLIKFSIKVPNMSVQQSHRRLWLVPKSFHHPFGEVLVRKAVCGSAILVDNLLVLGHIGAGRCGAEGIEGQPLGCRRSKCPDGPKADGQADITVPFLGRVP